MRIVLIVLLFSQAPTLSQFPLVFTQQQEQDPERAPGEHTPEPCDRTGGVSLPDGRTTHACACERMGKDDGGEGCEPTYPEPRDCKSYCKMHECACPVTCDVIP